MEPEADAFDIFYAALPDRALIAVFGADAKSFLQSLVTNDVSGLTPGQAVYAGLLTPQGKILYEFYVVQDGENLLLDCAAIHAEALRKRLAMYRLRASIDITPVTDRSVVAMWREDGVEIAIPTADTALAFADPRRTEMGLRLIGTNDGLAQIQTETDGAMVQWALYNNYRLDVGVPDAADMPPDTVFALDAGFEELNGVNFKKGCYIGQEVTARMKHRTTARKRFLIAKAEILAPPSGTPIFVGDREIGTFASGSGQRALALIRLDRWEPTDAATSKNQKVKLTKPHWLDI